MQGAVEETVEEATGVAGSVTAAKKIKINGSGYLKPILEKCGNCERIVVNDDAQHCRTYADPSAKWRAGMCNFATHVKPEILTAKIKVNPLKASKRASAK